MSCVVYGCPNSNVQTADPLTHFYSFPKDPATAQQWIRACYIQENEVDLNQATICSAHFDEDNYHYEIRVSGKVTCLVKILKNDAFPTLHMPTTIQVFTEDENEKEVIVLTIATKRVTNAVEEEQIELQVEAADEKPENIEKYNRIKSNEQLALIKIDNEKLEEKIETIENNLAYARQFLLEQIERFKKSNVELEKLRRERDQVAQITYDLTRKGRFTYEKERELLAKVFSQSQIKILAGKQKTLWTHDDMAVAYTIRHLSSRRHYRYLTQTLKIPLPGLSSVERWRYLGQNPKRKKLLAKRGLKNSE